MTIIKFSFCVIFMLGSVAVFAIASFGQLSLAGTTTGSPAYARLPLRGVFDRKDPYWTTPSADTNSCSLYNGQLSGTSSEGSLDPNPLIRRIEELLTDQKSVRLDLYVMSQCPFAMQAERVIFPSIERFGERVDVHLNFIGRVDTNGKVSSMHGDEEIVEDLRQMAVEDKFPERLSAYLVDRANGSEWRNRSDFDPTYLKTKYMATLSANMRATAQLGIEASPTIMLDGERVEEPFRKVGGNAVERPLQFCIDASTCNNGDTCTQRICQFNNCIFRSAGNVEFPVIDPADTSAITGGFCSIASQGNDSCTLRAAVQASNQVYNCLGPLTLKISYQGTILVRSDTPAMIRGHKVNIASGSTLGGSGTLTAPVNVLSGGSIAPGTSPGAITTGNLTFSAGSNYNVEIGGTTAGADYDQLVVNGTVDLGGSTLNLSAINGFVPTAGQTFTIIDNDGADAVTGTFAGLAQSSSIPNFLGSSLSASISYTGGTGNDVVISVLAPTAAQVSISGRVMTPNGMGLQKALVSLIDQNGHTRRVISSPFGYYRFVDVTAGENYIIAVSSKRFTFAPRVLTVNDQLTDVDLIAEP